ncbi:MAG TPA: HDOD domain-containing protein [Steroidobacteraceae bacterium]|nr:HDOD domain-containing protein [Steroidobacteraceae bacterium]
MSPPNDVPPADRDDAAFEFVQSLAAELSGGVVDIPGFPSIVTRLQRLLSDESASTDTIVRVVGADPVLAARLLKLANSAAILGTRPRASDLRTAIDRVGLSSLRAIAHGHAVRVLRQTEALKGLQKPLEVLAGRAAHLASLSHVVARHSEAVEPDVAMLAGLLQSVGKLYLLTRAGNHRALFGDANAFRNIERDWHLNVAVALLENWGIPEEIVKAVAESEDLSREPRGGICLSDILLLAIAIAQHGSQPALLDQQLRETPCLARFNLAAGGVADLLRSAKEEMELLQAALV